MSSQLSKPTLWCVRHDCEKFVPAVGRGGYGDCSAIMVFIGSPDGEGTDCRSFKPLCKPEALPGQLAFRLGGKDAS